LIHKKIKALVAVLIVGLSLWSCSDESESETGCTDCNAANYQPFVTEDDSSCVFLNTGRLGEYAVTDSALDWTQDWWFDSYNISIMRDSCNSMGVKIDNFANWYTLTDSYAVSAEIKGDSIFIPYQIIDNGGPQTIDRIEISESDGYFNGDSIFFHFFYLDGLGDPYYGHLEGKKIN
jgi:hypothetical protein